MGFAWGAVGFRDDNIVMGPAKLEESFSFELLLLGFGAYEAFRVPNGSTVIAVKWEFVLLWLTCVVLAVMFDVFFAFC